MTEAHSLQNRCISPAAAASFIIPTQTDSAGGRFPLSFETREMRQRRDAALSSSSAAAVMQIYS